MAGRNHLFVPGPTNVPDRILRAMHRAMEDHRSSDFPGLAGPLFQELKKIFIAVTKLEDAVVDKQLRERTELTHNKVGPAQRESILEAGLALQKAGVIGASVDVKKAVDDLIDDRHVTVTN